MNKSNELCLSINKKKMVKWKKESEIAQLCPILCDAMDCSLLGSTIHGIFQARTLERAAISFSRGSSQPRARTQVSRIVECRFTVWATREVLGRKVMTNLDGMLKSRDITVNKCLSSQGYGFSIVMYGCESWTIKKAECWRIDAFEMWFWKDSWESLGLQGDPTS